MGIDPANKQTAYVILDRNFKLYDSGLVPNDEFLEIMERSDYDTVACEIIVNFGVSGASLFETAEFIGKIDLMSEILDKPFHRIKRTDTKKHFDVKRSTKYKKVPNADTQISRYLQTRFAKEPKVNFGKGLKGKPDYFYGFKADMWQAMGVGVYYIDTTNHKQKKLFDKNN